MEKEHKNACTYRGGIFSAIEWLVSISIGRPNSSVGALEIHSRLSPNNGNPNYPAGFTLGIWNVPVHDPDALTKLIVLQRVDMS